MTLSPDILEEVLSEIIQFGVEQMPAEAVGLLTPEGQICFLTNETEELGQYLVSGDQLVVALSGLFDEEPSIERLADLVIWHTHPSGFVGPSKRDLESRRQPILNEMAHLVISLPEGQAVYF